MYYHEITPGFNWWYITGPLMLIMMFYLGTKRFSIKKGHLRRMAKERTYKLASIICGIIFMVQLSLESANGIVQIYDNGLRGNDSPALSVSFAMGTIVIATMFYTVAADEISVKGGKVAKKQLKNPQN